MNLTRNLRATPYPSTHDLAGRLVGDVGGDGGEAAAGVATGMANSGGHRPFSARGGDHLTQLSDRDIDELPFVSAFAVCQ